MVDHSGLIDLWEEIHADPSFAHFRTSSLRLVPGMGADRPRVMVIGEAPSAMDNTSGLPFSGYASHVIHELMGFAGLSALAEGNAWLTLVVKYRPPGGRPPRWQEIMDFRPYILREWRLVGRPGVIIPVGQTALSCLRRREENNILAVAGTCIPRPPTSLWPMIHPAFGIRHPEYQDRIEADWETLGAWLQENGIVT